MVTSQCRCGYNSLCQYNVVSEIKIIKRPMDHTSHLRGISKQWTNLSKVMIIQAAWFKVVIISPWKGVWSFIRTNLNTLHPRMLCSSAEENVSKLSVYFQFFATSPLGKELDPSFEQNLNFIISGYTLRNWFISKLLKFSFLLLGA